MSDEKPVYGVLTWPEAILGIVMSTCILAGLIYFFG